MEPAHKDLLLTSLEFSLGQNVPVSRSIEYHKELRARHFPAQLEFVKQKMGPRLVDLYLCKTTAGTRNKQLTSSKCVRRIITVCLFLVASQSRVMVVCGEE